MITIEDLRKSCNITGFSLWQAERDYLQYLFLLFLSRNTTSLMFKGGTALQKVYGLNRFSIDLDFTQMEDADFDIIISKVAKAMTDFGYPSKVEEIKTLGRTFNFKIQGPLYKNNPLTIATLRIEISQRENILLKPTFKEIVPIYNDIQAFTLLTMNIDEILSEKVRAIMTRNKSRDVFDIHFILRKNSKFDLTIVNKKLEYFKTQFDKKVFIEKIKEKKSIWEKEMKNYISEVPDFDVVCKEIMEKLNL